MPKFKIGQKVCVKEWLDIPEELLVDWGIVAHIGDVGIVVKENAMVSKHNTYDVKTKSSKSDFFCFEDELEPVIKIGEQLVFNFMEE